MAQSDFVAGVFLVHFERAASAETTEFRKAVGHIMVPPSVRKTDEDGEDDESAKDVDVGLVLDPYKSLGCREGNSVVEHPTRKAERESSRRIVPRFLGGLKNGQLL